MKRSRAALLNRWAMTILVSLSAALLYCLYCLVSPALPSGKVSQVAVFEQVWQTVQENFYDPRFNGVNWPAMRQKYRPQAEKAQSTEALSGVVNQMLAELKTSHTRFYTQTEPAYYQLSGIFKASIQDKLKPFLPNGKLEYTDIGIYTEEIDGSPFIKAILDGSPAAKAKLLVGDRILSVDGQPFQPIASFANKANQSVKIKIQRTADPASVQEISVTPQRLDPSTLFLDAMKASVETIDRQGQKIGYVHIWSYAGEMYQDQLEEELTTGRLRDADALIWDLRDGWGGASPDYLSLFTASVPTVTLVRRDGKQDRFDGQWKKPVVMLVNQGSRSGKEILAYGFRKYQVGPIVGSKTAGAVVAGRAFVMQDGSLLYLAVADVRVDGERLEGKGIAPDVDAPRAIAYSQGSDPQKEQAIRVALDAANKRSKSS